MSTTPPAELETKPEAMRALLVEDDERLARLTARYLETHGVTVTWVTDGQAGLDQALREGADIVLLDLSLPGRDGLEVCRELRAYSDVPIVMITARDEESYRVLGLE